MLPADAWNLNQSARPSTSMFSEIAAVPLPLRTSSFAFGQLKLLWVVGGGAVPTLVVPLSPTDVDAAQSV